MTNDIPGSMQRSRDREPQRPAVPETDDLPATPDGPEQEEGGLAVSEAGGQPSEAMETLAVNEAAHAADPETMGRVVCFGEAMVRLTPPGNERLERATTLDVTAGGAELNTAVALAILGFRAAWVSALPTNGMGRLIARQAQANGVDISDVNWVSEEEGRAGIYVLEEGVDPRPSSVTYDRAGSAIARVGAGTFNWDAILEGAAALHISGITLALSDTARAEAMDAARAAKARNVVVAFDLNYRSKLWGENEAREAFTEIVPYVDVLFASSEALETFFGITGEHEEVLRSALEQLGVAVIALTLKRATRSRRLQLMSLALGQSGVLASTEWRDVEVVDRLGGGDAFAAGFLAGYLENSRALTHAVALGAAASALKHTMPGDFLSATREEIEAAMADTSASMLLR